MGFDAVTFKICSLRSAKINESWKGWLFFLYLFIYFPLTLSSFGSLV